ncbi:MAG: hypothetical protein IPJ88_05820 [Myxococcales bacterium]|nr:MAG: hypothetical protein IPJ88_05820 [Myxococcales bacterium]
MKARHLALSLFLLVNVGGCTSHTQNNVGPIIDLASAQVLDPEDDPFLQDQPDSFDCQRPLPILEADALEFNTANCDYYLVRFPLLKALRVNQSVSILFWYSDLRASEATTGHVAIVINGQLLWEKSPPIPSSSRIFQEKVPLTFNAELGEDLIIHLHNHGENSWKLGSLELIH